MSQQLERDVRFLKRYSIAMTAIVFVLSVAAFVRPARHEKFTEIDVERINVMEPDGKYRLVISNKPRSIGPIYKGEPFGYKGGNRPGLIWFNDEGTENGGMTFQGSRGADGKYQASTHMSFDQFDEDQILNLDYSDDRRGRLTGFTINDRADVNIFTLSKQQDSIMAMKDTVARNAALQRLVAPRNGVPLAAQRAFFGRDRAKNASVVLSDPMAGRDCVCWSTRWAHRASEFLDDSGHVTNRLTGAAK